MILDPFFIKEQHDFGNILSLCESLVLDLKVKTLVVYPHVCPLVKLYKRKQVINVLAVPILFRLYSN